MKPRRHRYSLIKRLSMAVLFVLFGDYRCLFKSITGIPCPGCGLTRASGAMLRFDFAQAARYNMMSLPLAGAAAAVLIVVVTDLVCKTQTLKCLQHQVCKPRYVALAAFVTVLSWTNNILNAI